jgi:hypothetical protein
MSSTGSTRLQAKRISSRAVATTSSLRSGLFGGGPGLKYVPITYTSRLMCFLTLPLQNVPDTDEPSPVTNEPLLCCHNKLHIPIGQEQFPINPEETEFRLVTPELWAKLVKRYEYSVSWNMCMVPIPMTHALIACLIRRTHSRHFLYFTSISEEWIAL